MITRKEFIDIVSGYNGKVEETDTKVSFTSVNRITSYYVDGSIHKRKNVECCIEWSNGALCAEEKTYEILGGCCIPEKFVSKEDLLYNLKCYNFAKKEIPIEQLSLFS